MNSTSICLLKKRQNTIGIGTLCQFSTNNGIFSAEEMNSLKASAIPGFMKHTAPFESHYAILTAHKVIPSFSEPEDLEDVSYVYTDNRPRSLADAVTGGISCCGSDCVLGQGCEISLPKHGGENCHGMGLDFTILFLKDGVIDNLNLPCIRLNPTGDMCFCIASYSDVDKLLEVNTTSDGNIVIDDAAFDVKTQLEEANGEKNDASDSGVRILTKKADGESIAVKVYVHKKLLEEELRANPPQTLSNQIDIFVSTKNLEYVIPESFEILPGSPILFKDVVNGQSAWIGMHTGSSNNAVAQKCMGVSLLAIQMLLQGGPVPVLSLLDTCHQVRRLWVEKYAHMLLPFLETGVFHLGNRLELLYYLVKNHCGGEQVLNIKGQDLPSVKKACMDLLTAILSPFSYKQHDVATVINCGGGVLDKPGEEEAFRKGLTNVIHGLRDHLAFPSNDEDTVESTLLCCNALLNLNFRDLVMNEIGREGFDHLKKLTRRDKFKNSHRIQSLCWEIMYKKAKRDISDLRAQVKSLEQEKADLLDLATGVIALPQEN